MPVCQIKSRVRLYPHKTCVSALACGNSEDTNGLSMENLANLLTTTLKRTEFMSPIGCSKITKRKRARRETKEKGRMR